MLEAPEPDGGNEMKKAYLLIIIISLIAFYSYAITFSIKEIWNGKTERRAITQLNAIDINKNGIKEVVVVCNYSSPLGKYGIDLGSYGYMKLYEWNGSSLVKKWGHPEITKGITASIVKAGEQEFLEVGTFSLNILNYKDGKYSLEKIEKSMKLSWPNEEPFAKGSFVKRGFEDIIVTGYFEKKNYHIRFREAKKPDHILWTSPILKKGSGMVVFGDFNKDGEIELLLESGYWIYPDGKDFKMVEIKSYRESKYGTMLSLFPRDAGKSLKAGRTTSKDFDEIFFIEELLYGGPLFKAVWQKDKFEFEEILQSKKIVGYDNLNLSYIDNDGLDEIIISEIRGDLIETEEEPFIKNRHDVIHILKWDGKEYKKIWTSQARGAITQVLVDDVTGDGKKEIVVGNDKGEIYIFGQN